MEYEITVEVGGSAEVKVLDHGDVDVVERWLTDKLSSDKKRKSSSD